MPNPRVSYCIFCDDIRQEVGGKTSLIGIYHGDMIFPFAKPIDNPILYPKFAAFISVISDPNDNPDFIKLKVIEESLESSSEEDIKVVESKKILKSRKRRLTRDREDISHQLIKKMQFKI